MYPIKQKKGTLNSICEQTRFWPALSPAFYQTRCPMRRSNLTFFDSPSPSVRCMAPRLVVPPIPKVAPPAFSRLPRISSPKKTLHQTSVPLPARRLRYRYHNTNLTSTNPHTPPHFPPSLPSSTPKLLAPSQAHPRCSASSRSFRFSSFL